MSHHRQAMYDLGVYPTLELSSEEACALSKTDLTELRLELGATPAMLARLRVLARVSGRTISLNFQRQTVTTTARSSTAERGR